jgi:hypothetical protein
MSKFLQNANAVLVGSFPPVGDTRQACELHDSPGCEGFGRTMCVNMPGDPVQACVPCAEFGREYCELRFSRWCEELARPVSVETPAGVVTACATCAYHLSCEAQLAS